VSVPGGGLVGSAPERDQAKIEAGSVRRCASRIAEHESSAETARIGFSNQILSRISSWRHARQPP